MKKHQSVRESDTDASGDSTCIAGSVQHEQVLFSCFASPIDAMHLCKMILACRNLPVPSTVHQKLSDRLHLLGSGREHLLA